MRSQCQYAHGSSALECASIFCTVAKAAVPFLERAELLVDEHARDFVDVLGRHANVLQVADVGETAVSSVLLAVL